MRTGIVRQNGLRIMHVALGGCLHGGDIDYGVTEDTGGHIAYVMGAARAQAERADVAHVEIVTRAFDDAGLGRIHAQEREAFHPNGTISRIWSRRRGYLEKDDLVADLPSLIMAFLEHLRAGPKPDVIHAHFSDAATLARAAERTFGIPWVFSSHSLAMEKSGNADPARVARECDAIRGAGAIIASSRDEAERQIVAGDASAAGRVRRISPGVTLLSDVGTDGARALIAPRLTRPEKPILLAIARPVWKKNLAALVEAYAADADLRAAANLVILAGQHAGLSRGESEAAQVLTDLRARIARHGLTGQVALPASHTARDVRALYALAAQSGVFVNPAVTEPFGLTVVEAAQAGCPVVATCYGGPPGILEDIGYGRVIDPQKPNDIAAACLDLLRDPDRSARTTQAAQRAERLFSWARWADRSVRVYRDLRRPAAVTRPLRRLIVSDIDGTLTGDRQAATDLVHFLAHRRDVGFTVATGRSISEARRVLAEWRLPEPDTIIASVGSEIWHHSGQSAYALDHDHVEAMSQDWQPERIRFLVNALGVTPQPAHDQRRWKLSYFADAATAGKIRDMLQTVGLAVRVIHSHGRFLDILPVRAGKAAAMAHVAAQHRLSARDCIACGDSGNDADMLQAAGCAVLPANALPELDGLKGRHILRSSERFAAGTLDCVRRALDASADALVAAE
ncbi:HAD-IIB family hydrolase [Marivita sp. S0852]|uniref:HAD-IIB family hydrolase n=1 Tax=Marivita sp. S0852 TaxID=3373893 RepID=UPI00398198B5